MLVGVLVGVLVRGGARGCASFCDNGWELFGLSKPVEDTGMAVLLYVAIRCMMHFSAHHQASCSRLLVVVSQWSRLVVTVVACCLLPIVCCHSSLVIRQKCHGLKAEYPRLLFTPTRHFLC